MPASQMRVASLGARKPTDWCTWATAQPSFPEGPEPSTQPSFVPREPGVQLGVLSQRAPDKCGGETFLSCQPARGSSVRERGLARAGCCCCWAPTRSLLVSLAQKVRSFHLHSQVTGSERTMGLCLASVGLFTSQT